MRERGGERGKDRERERERERGWGAKRSHNYFCKQRYVTIQIPLPLSNSDSLNSVCHVSAIVKKANNTIYT